MRTGTLSFASPELAQCLAHSKLLVSVYWVKWVKFCRKVFMEEVGFAGVFEESKGRSFRVRRDKLENEQKLPEQ